MPALLEFPSVKSLRLLVAGEVVLDRYFWGAVDRISPEAPIPVLQVDRTEDRPGNAAFVSALIAGLGAQASVLSVAGDDGDGVRLRGLLGALGVSTDGLIEDSQRRTIVKERFLGSVQSAHRATQQLLRVDNEDSRPVTADTEARLIARVEAELDQADGVLICDINKGVLTASLLESLIGGARSRNKPVVVDPRLSNDFKIYHGATALTPNRYESERATGLLLADSKAWSRAAHKLIQEVDLSACLITLDREGMFLANRDGHDIHIPTTPREVYDVTGAGDVVLATFGLFLTAGLSFSDAAALANVAAGLEVARQGASPITRAELHAALQREYHGSSRKIVALEEIEAILAPHRMAGRRICFTNGCFDLLHAGHVQALEFARAQGDLLVVGLNGDNSVREIKGDGRPVYSANDRARILAALESVDYVVVFDEPRAEGIIRKIRPDILVKGEDWRGKVIDGAEFVRSYGGMVILAALLEGHGTTRTIEKLVNRFH